MKYAPSSEHCEFFEKHQAIEFDGLLTSEQVSSLNKSLDILLAERLGINPNLLKSQTADKLFMAGRDLWKSSPELKKIICSDTLAEIASKLVICKPLRLAYDQLIVPPFIHSTHFKDLSPYSKLIQKKISLQSMSSIQGIVCGLMICLSSSNQGHYGSEGELRPDFFSLKAGNGVYFNPSAEIDFPYLAEHQGQRYLLIVYTQSTMVYIMQPEDPHAHHLKTMGYHYGDLLTIKHHPVVYK